MPTLLILHASQVVGADLRCRGTTAPDLSTLYRYLYQFFHVTDCLSDSRFWASGASDAYATLGEAVELDGPARSAEDLDLHAERYRMIELD